MYYIYIYIYISVNIYSSQEIFEIWNSFLLLLKYFSQHSEITMTLP